MPRSLAPATPPPRTWDACKKDFLKLLPQVSTSRDIRDIFCDVCRIFSLSLRGVMAIGEEKRRIEEEYARYAKDYGSEGMEKASSLFSLVVEALEIRRSDFLGHIYEELNATNKHFGQFFTPDSVSRFMGEITIDKPIPGYIVTLSDPACGAGALLIEGAEHFVAAGGRQGDIMVYADDLDATACCICYVQLSLLGYPAVIRRMDSIAMKVYEGPWYTFGYFAHGTSYRLQAQRLRESEQAQPSEPPSPEAPSTPATAATPAPAQPLLPLFA